MNGFGEEAWAMLIRLSIQPTVEVTEAEWERVFTVNVKSIFLGSQVFVKRLLEQGGGGSMINISSTGATRPRPGLVWYNASKGAVSNVSVHSPVAFEESGVDWWWRMLEGTADTPDQMTTGNQRSRGRVWSAQYPGQHRLAVAVGDRVVLLVHRHGRYAREPGEVHRECALGTADGGG